MGLFAQAALIVFIGGNFVGCASTSDRGPAARESELKLEKVKANLILDRAFVNLEPVQRTNKICGHLFKVNEDFYLRSSCQPNKNSPKYYGLSKVPPSDQLLKITQAAIWSEWTSKAQDLTKSSGDHQAPFICMRGNIWGDACDKKNGAVFQRVRDFTSREEDADNWED